APLGSLSGDSMIGTGSSQPSFSVPPYSDGAGQDSGVPSRYVKPLPPHPFSTQVSPSSAQTSAQVFMLSEEAALRTRLPGIDALAITETEPIPKSRARARGSTRTPARPWPRLVPGARST